MWAASKFTDHLPHMVSAEHRNCQKIPSGLIAFLAGAAAGYGLEVQAELLWAFPGLFPWATQTSSQQVLGFKKEHFRGRHFRFLRTQSHKMQTFISDVSNPRSVSQSQPLYTLPVIESCHGGVKYSIDRTLIVHSMAMTVYGVRWILDLPG